MRKAGTESALKWMSEMSCSTILERSFVMSIGMFLRDTHSRTISIPLSVSQSRDSGLTMEFIGIVSRFPPGVNRFFSSYSERKRRAFGP